MAGHPGTLKEQASVRKVHGGNVDRAGCQTSKSKMRLGVPRASVKTPTTFTFAYTRTMAGVSAETFGFADGHSTLRLLQKISD